jgi:hypothetical protein
VLGIAFPTHTISTTPQAEEIKTHLIFIITPLGRNSNWRQTQKDILNILWIDAFWQGNIIALIRGDNDSRMGHRSGTGIVV